MDENLHTNPNAENDQIQENKLLNYIDSYAVPEKTSQAEMLQNIYEKAKTEQPKGRISKLPVATLWYAVAAVAIFAVILLVPTNTTTEKITALPGSVTKFILPDGSEVMLNAGSEIDFDKSKFTNNRTLQLNGEAFFEVKKGSAFTVNTMYGEVEVLGTSFNVNTRNLGLTVSCATGKVRVTAGNSTEIIVPGEEVEQKGAVLVKTAGIDVERMGSWATGKFYFENTPVLIIFDELERQYKIEISSTVDTSRLYTGSFKTGNLKENLEVICIPLNLKYEFKTENTIVISTKAQ